MVEEQKQQPNKQPAQQQAETPAKTATEKQVEKQYGKPVEKKEQPKDTQKEFWDTIVIGTGIVGWAGAMYAGRLNLKTLVIGEKLGGTLILTDLVENYPGFKKLTGFELTNNVEQHAREYDI